jgi:hypothetical protein
MSIPNCIDRMLTKSWRFGPAIAQMANIALFVKENSPQTTNYVDSTRRLWLPYRVEAGRGKADSIVTPRSLLQRDWWTKRPVTIIGRKNGSLLKKALELMDLGYLEQVGAGPNDKCGVECLGLGAASADVEALLLNNVPKFHINGKGESSGVRAWRTAIKQIEHL